MSRKYDPSRLHTDSQNPAVEVYHVSRFERLQQEVMQRGVA